MRGLLSLLLVVAVCQSGLAAPLLSPLFQNHAVLQRDKPTPIWGTATPGEAVVVEFRSQRREATADETGRWLVTLDAMPASAEPATLRVTSSAGAARADNVLVGEVWFCAGQSNMAWTVQNSLNPEQELAAADYPQIRYFRVRGQPAQQPQRDDPKLGAWLIARSGTRSGGDDATMTRAFGAVSYFFAREIHRRLNVPVGVINSSVGGTRIEAWTALTTLEQSPAWPSVQARWQQRLDAHPAAMDRYQRELAEYEQKAKAAREAGTEPPRPPRKPEGFGSRWMPAGLYNGMVHPVAPLAIRGFLWYQGEANAPQHGDYTSQLTDLITQWRAEFGQGDLPFYFVQLPNLHMRTDPTQQMWAWQREAQQRALVTPHTAMAVTIDVGEPDNVHPRNKQEVGRRLALLALRRVYGQDVIDSGPIFQRAVVQGDSMLVTFTHDEGLTLAPGGQGAFELAGDDRVFHPAVATLDGTTLRVRSAQTPAPVAVRYAWKNNPSSVISNGAGLPAGPFRSDDWPATASASDESEP
jgi:sialate O-acetylesterase